MFEKTAMFNNCDMYELCSNLVFIILYILLDDEASINANHSCVNISFSFWLQALTNQVLFVKLCEYQIPPKTSEHITFLRLSIHWDLKLLVFWRLYTN